MAHSGRKRIESLCELDRVIIFFNAFSIQMSTSARVQSTTHQIAQASEQKQDVISHPRPRAQLMESRLTDAAAAWLCAPFPNLSVTELSDSLVRITERLGSTATEFLHALVLFYRFYARSGSEGLLRIHSMSELLYVVVLFLEVASKFSRENVVKVILRCFFIVLILLMFDSSPPYLGSITNFL